MPRPYVRDVSGGGASPVPGAAGTGAALLGAWAPSPASTGAGAGADVEARAGGAMPAPDMRESASASTRAREAWRRCSIPSRDADGWRARTRWTSPDAGAAVSPSGLCPAAAAGEAGGECWLVSEGEESLISTAGRPGRGLLRRDGGPATTASLEGGMRGTHFHATGVSDLARDSCSGWGTLSALYTLSEVRTLRYLALAHSSKP